MHFYDPASAEEILQIVLNPSHFCQTKFLNFIFLIKVISVDKGELQKGAKCCNVLQTVLQTSLKDGEFLFSYFDWKCLAIAHCINLN